MGVRNIACDIKKQALTASLDALNALDPQDADAFAAIIQVAVVGAGFSVRELSEALKFDTGSIIRWYQGIMAPIEPARNEIASAVKRMVAERLSQWEADSPPNIIKLY